MCMSCQKARAAGSKASSTRQPYSPKKMGTAYSSSSRVSSQYGTPKVRMSFGTRKRS